MRALFRCVGSSENIDICFVRAVQRGMGEIGCACGPAKYLLASLGTGRSYTRLFCPDYLPWLFFFEWGAVCESSYDVVFTSSHLGNMAQRGCQRFSLRVARQPDSVLA